MYKKDYDKLVDKLSADYILVDGECIRPSDTMVKEFVENSGIKQSTVESNRAMCESFIHTMITQFPHWRMGEEPEDILSNIAWMRVVLIVMTANEPMIYPEYRVCRNNDALGIYIDAIKFAISDLYTNTLRNMLDVAIPYMVGKVHAKVVGKVIIASDGSYLNIEDDKVRYGEDPTRVITYPNERYELAYFMDLMSIPKVDSDVINILRMMTSFTALINHNAKVMGVTMNNYEYTLHADPMLNITSEGEIDLRATLKYLNKLQNKLIDTAITAKENTIPILNDIMDRIPDGNGKLKVKLPDIAKLDPEAGLTLKTKDDEIFIDVQYENGDIVNIFSTPILPEKDSSNKEALVYNMCMGTCTHMGEMVSHVLKELGILDLFLQSPPTLDISVSDFLRNSDPEVHASSQKFEDHLYIITNEYLRIGQVSNNVFVSSILIARRHRGKVHSVTTRYRMYPNVKKFTPEVKEALKKFLKEDDYHVIENKLAEE